MLALQAQAHALTTRTPLSRDAALRSLQGLTPGQQIQLTPQGDRVTAQLKAVPAATLAHWLTQVRTQAQALPIEAHLTRGSSTDAVVWEGSLVLSLPNRDVKSPSAH
jgi:general secretion pathway protein M